MRADKNAYAGRKAIKNQICNDKNIIIEKANILTITNKSVIVQYLYSFTAVRLSG